jgi:TP901 family phage tail tape measure protein
MTNVGQVSFKMVLDTSNLRGEVSKVDALLARQTVRLRVGLDASSVRGDLTRLSQSLKDRNLGVRIPVTLDARGIRAQIAQISKEAQAIKVPVQAASGGPSSRVGVSGGKDAASLARDLAAAEAAAKRTADQIARINAKQQEKDAAALARELAKAEASAKKVADQAARIELRRQEKEAAAAARELEKAERAAKRAADQAARIDLKRQEREAAALAKETERAAAAAQRLAAQQARDQKIVAGAKYDSREVKQIEASLKRVAAETKKAEELAALLRQKYGLADEEARRLAGSISNVGRQQGQFNSLVAGFAGAAGFMALNTAMQALQGTVAGIVNTFVEASSAYREFEKNILMFQSRTQGATVNVEALEDEILRVAAATSQSPQSLSAAAAGLASLGVEADQVQGRLEGLAKASDVLGEDPETLARIFQGALAAYEQYGYDITSVSDIIKQALDTTAIGTLSGARELEQLFSKASAPAAALGVTLEELTTLDALFAEAGSRPEARATAVETLLTRIASRKDELEKEGVQLAIKENGGLDVEGTLQNLKTRLEEIPDTAGRLNLLRQFFGESSGNDILLAIERIDTSYANLAGSINNSSGALDRGFKIVSEGTEFQAGIVQGFVESARTGLGEALNPIERGFIALQQAALGLTKVDISPLTEGAERLGNALANNPELAQQLADVLSGIAQAAVNQIANILDALTALSSNQDFISSLDDIGNSIENVIALFGRLTQSVIGAFEIIAPLFDAREVLPGIETSIIGLFQPLNLLQVAAQAIGSAFGIARDALQDFAERFPLVVAAIKSAIPGLGIASAAVGALVDRIPDRFKGGREPEPAPAPEQPASAPEPQDNRDRAGQQPARPEVTPSRPINQVSQEGLAADSGRIRANKALTTRLNTIQEGDSAARISLTEQGANQEAFAAQERKTLDQRISARQTFIDRIKELQQRPGNSVEENLALESALADAEKDLAADRLTVVQNFQRDRKQILDNVVRDSEEAFNKLDRDNARATLTTAQQGLDAGDNAVAGIRNERRGIERRLSNREGLLGQLRERQRAGGLSDEDSRALNQQIVDTEKEIYGLRLDLLNNFRTERQQILDNIQADNQQDLALLERDQAAAAAALAESPLSDRDRASASAQAEQQALQNRIANQESLLAELRQQQSIGGLSPEDAQALGNQIVSVETAIFNQRAQLATSFEAERRRLAEQGFADQLLALNQLKQQEDLINQSRLAALSNQQQLLEATTTLEATQTQLGQTRLSTALSLAQSELRLATSKRDAVSAQREIIALQRESVESQIEAAAREAAARRQMFKISAQQTRLEAQRAIRSAEVAALEAQIAAQKAITNRATVEEIEGLQAIAALTAQGVDDARSAAAVADQVLTIKREELTLQEQLTAEQIRQNNLVDQGNRLADARRGIIGALAAESSTSREDSLDALEGIRERFRDARSAGLFRGENVNEAISQVESAIQGSNDRRLFELAQSDNPLVTQLIDAAGRSDITGLVAADKELALAKAVQDGNDAIVNRLDTLIEQGLGARIEQLNVSTPDPVADTSRIVADIAKLQTAGVNA